MDPAAPFLFPDRPACLPIGKSIIAIVRICRPRWECRLHWRKKRLHWRKDRLHWHRRWRSRRAAAMVNPATPLFLIRCPGVFWIHSAVEWVNRARGCGRSSRRRRGRRRGRRRRRRRWERSRRHGLWDFWQSRCRAASTHRHTAILFLCLRPHGIQVHSEASFAIVWQRSGCS